MDWLPLDWTNWHSIIVILPNPCAIIIWGTMVCKLHFMTLDLNGSIKVSAAIWPISQWSRKCSSYWKSPNCTNLYSSDNPLRGKWEWAGRWPFRYKGHMANWFFVAFLLIFLSSSIIRFFKEPTFSFVDPLYSILFR